MTDDGDPFTPKCLWTPLSAMESGPSVRWAFAGVGMSDCTSVLAPAPVVAAADDDVEDHVVAAEADVEAVTVFVSVLVAPESEEWPQATAVSPITIAAAAVRYVWRLMYT